MTTRGVLPEGPGSTPDGAHVPTPLGRSWQQHDGAEAVVTVSTDHAGGGSASRSPEDNDTKAQLARLEDGLVAELGGSTDANAVLREHVDRSLCGFSAARIQRYLPILIERAVRRRLHGS